MKLENVSLKENLNALREINNKRILREAENKSFENFLQNCLNENARVAQESLKAQNERKSYDFNQFNAVFK